MSMSSKGADGIKNSSLDPDLTTAVGAIYSGSEQFAWTCLSEK